MWDQFMRDLYENQRLVVERFDADGALKIDVSRTTDILRTINHPAVYYLLVVERGGDPRTTSAGSSRHSTSGS